MTTLMVGYQNRWTPPTNPGTWQEEPPQPPPNQTSFHQQTDQDDDDISECETVNDNQSVANNTSRTDNRASAGHGTYFSGG